MTPVSTLIHFELSKLLRRPMTKILGFAFFGIGILVFGTIVGLILISDSSLSSQIQEIDGDDLRETILLPDGIFFGGTLVSIIGSTLLIILAAGSIGSEFTWATFRTGVFMGASRTRILVAKFLALGIITMAVAVLGLAWTTFLSIISKLIVGEAEVSSTAITSGFVGDVLLTLGVVFVMMLVWAVISMGITLVTHSLATGLGITLVVSLLGGQVALLIGQLGTPGTWISRTFPNTAVDKIGTLLSSNASGLAAVDWVWITLNIAGWAAMIVAVSLTRFRRMDLLATS